MLPAVCRYGTGQFYALHGSRLQKKLAKAAGMGCEFWVAETKTEADDIGLLSYLEYYRYNFAVCKLDARHGATILLYSSDSDTD